LPLPLFLLLPLLVDCCLLSVSTAITVATTAAVVHTPARAKESFNDIIIHTPKNMA